MANTLIGIFLEAVSSYRKPDLFMRPTPSGWERLSAERVLADVEALGLALRDLGIAPGDRVAILSENRYEWPLSDLAILGLGAVTVPIYPTLTPAQVAFMLANSEARLAIVSTEEQQRKLHSAADELPRLETIVHLEPAAERHPKATTMEALLERGRALRELEPEAFRGLAGKVGPEDLATIIYTSGTTGEPKGAMLTHGNIAFDVESCLQVVGLAPADICLSFLPLCHIFERMGGLYAMMSRGVTIAYARSIDQVSADMLEVRPTVLTGVPRFYEKAHARILETAATFSPLKRRLFDWGIAVGIEKARAHFEGRELNSPATKLADLLVASKIRERMGGRLRFCISGGAPLSPSVMEFFFAIGVPILEGYGLTETSPVICLNPPGRERPGTVGLPIPGVEVRIGEDGEILTRGPHVMRGYFRNEEATRQALRDGWFHTGDVGCIEPDGRLVITDRLKDLLITAGGKKVAPQPLEARLKNSKWIGEAVLIGDRRPYVTCLLVPDFAQLEAEARTRGWPASPRGELLARPEVVALFQSAIDALNSRLAQFEQIKRFTLLEQELTQAGGELTPTLKVRRRVICEKYAEQIDGLYAGRAQSA